MLLCSSELQCPLGRAHCSPGPPATSKASPRCPLCSAGEVSSKASSSLWMAQATPCGSHGAAWGNHREPMELGGGRARGRTRGWHWHLGEAAGRVPHARLKSSGDAIRLVAVAMPWAEGCRWPRHRESRCVPGCRRPCGWPVPADGSRDASQPGSAWGPASHPDLGIIFSRIKSLNVSV